MLMPNKEPPSSLRLFIFFNGHVKDISIKCTYYQVLLCVAREQPRSEDYLVLRLYAYLTN